MTKEEHLIQDALDIAEQFGNIDGSRHKMWVIDQMCRKLLGSEEKYEEWIKIICNGEDGPDTYDWETGTAP